MTAQELLTATQRAGITLIPSGDRLRVRALAGVLTPDLQATLANRKAELLPILSRLTGMRATVGRVPIPCAIFHAVGGPGRCFSCGDALDHPVSYGRCAPCDIACELFYRECPDAADRWEASAAAAGTESGR